MTLHNRFQFLNLWDEAADKGEDEQLGPVGEQQSVSSGASQWSSESSSQGKCFRSLGVSTERKRLKKLLGVGFFHKLIHPAGGSKYRAT